MHPVATRALQGAVWLALTLPCAAHAMKSDAPPDAIRDLAPRGTLRAAINFGNPVLAQKDPATGEPRGVSVDLARELGRRLGVPVELVTFDAAGKVFDALRDGAWDVAFLAIDPARAAGIDFTQPYVRIEGTYLVPEGSPLRKVEDADRDGVRVAVGRGSAYDLFLTRAVKHATLVRADTGAAALDAFVAEELEAAAGVRQALETFAKAHPGLRVMDGAFMSIEQAMGTPRGRDAGARYLRAFVGDALSSGLVSRGLLRSGQADVSIAPAGSAR
ncbi:MAG TPA: ABC transporter substrate-binding protein [Anaeromyxobacter sp.]|nr:ABC transporter substrate-binding protein [Anaeromyxobacter sp.]